MREKRERMKAYSKFLRLCSICNLVMAFLFTVLGFVDSRYFESGRFFNLTGTVFGLEAFGGMLLLTFIFYRLLGSEKIDLLWKWDRKRGFVYGILAINVVFRLFFHGKSASESGRGLTGDQVMASIALALLLNFTTYILTTQFIRSPENRENSI